MFCIIEVKSGIENMEGNEDRKKHFIYMKCF